MIRGSSIVQHSKQQQKENKMDIEMLNEMLCDMGYDDWYVMNESSLITPNGHEIEWDGVSPDGERSPLMALGII
jgi:hypothetical protein